MPVKIIFGCGKINELEKIIGSMNRKNGVLICDPFFKENGLADKVLSLSGGKLTKAFSDFSPNPSVESADKCAAFMREHGADFAVAMGGGSAIDCAKAGCAVAGTGDSVRLYHSGEKQLSKNGGIPLIAIPTTSGTGSEVTCVSVLTDTEKNVKAPLSNPALYPKMAIIDPELTLSVPKSVTASTGLDVLSHALEGFWSIHHQPICDALAQRATKLVFENLVSACNDPGNIRAREKMSEASLLAGIAFSHPKTTVCHACSFSLTNDYGIPHGEACAFTLGYAIRINADCENGRLHDFAKSVGFMDAYRMADRVDGIKSLLGMRCTLREMGIDRKDIPSLAKSSMHPNILNNPVELTVEAVEAMYRNLF